ncbi:MAG: DUF4859 domain-containing protein [Bacteroidaceae bacterium]|nr:DUF4859 domain-containing protein [Bacteroidaceae bacterium]
MRKRLLSTIVALIGAVSCFAQQLPDTLWFKYNDRFTANNYIPLLDVDSVEFVNMGPKLWKTSKSSGDPMSLPRTYFKEGLYAFDWPGRTLAKPNYYANSDYTNVNSQWCFERSMESDHFICFWEKGLTKSGDVVSGVNIKTLLSNAEKIWDTYVTKLGFLVPGTSITDNNKLHMYIVNTTDWRADGSGADGTEYYYDGNTKKNRNRNVGLFHCSPWAASAGGGHTVAHEIGHVFQYLVHADLGSTHGFDYGYGAGASGGNCWWEDCANWQAYKVYPNLQFSDGTYLELYMTTAHLNILNEKARYNNCFYQDYWCMKHGMNTVGRVWRESIKPEDPMEAYMRLFNLTLSEFADEMYDCFARTATWDIDGVRDYAKAKIGIHPQCLMEPSKALRDAKLNGEKEWWVVNPEACPENFGHNINPLKVPTAGTTVRATFRGIVGAEGYRQVNTSKAGWRYGLVAYTSDGKRVYSDMQSNANDGTAELVVPEKCEKMWLVVMGAPTEYWRHPWDDNTSNDEQWPYAVKFEGTDPLGASHTYDEFPTDYVRKDTTVVLNATLAYSSSAYSSVRVQYDMDAIAQALGLSTAKMKSVKCNDSVSNPGDIRFAGVNANGTMNFNTTTSTSSATCYGHWFNVSGNVCNYDGSALVFAEMYPESYGCYVGQYPGRLTKGKTYVIRQAIVYTHTDGKMYKAIMEVHLKVE